MLKRLDLDSNPDTRFYLDVPGTKGLLYPSSYSPQVYYLFSLNKAVGDNFRVAIVNENSAAHNIFFEVRVRSNFDVFLVLTQ